MDLWNKQNSDADGFCRRAMTIKVASIAVNMLGFFFAVFLCNCLHMLLRPISQPRIISESIVGLFLSNLNIVRKRLNKEVGTTLNYIVDVGMVFHMFVVGLEIDPNIFLQIPLPEAKVACTAMLSTFVLASLLVPFLRIPGNSDNTFNVCLSVMISGTSSPLLTRLITDLKIGKSDIGRFVVSAGVHSDVISTLIFSIGFIAFEPGIDFKLRSGYAIFKMSTGLLIQIVMAAKLTPSLMKWVNEENPEGKPFKGSHLVLSIAYVVMACSFSPIYGEYNKVLSAFFAGVFMPREGRISKLMISKVNYFFSTIFYPLFFFWVGIEAALSEFEAGLVSTWTTLICLFLISTVGKVIGSSVSGVLLGFHWPESIAIGLFLTVKGHFQVYLAITAWKMKLMKISSSIAMILVILITIIFKPLVVEKIIERARKRSRTQQMALQCLSPSNELRILLCIRGPKNASSSINFMEISRGPPVPGIIVYLTDMIELTDKIAATLTHTEGVDAVTVTEAEVVEMRKQITSAVDAYTRKAGEGITVRRTLALSTINNLHQDISILAQDLMVSLVVLPFHKHQEEDGRLGMGHSGYRHVNRKVLRNAPCSVGILVDRGFGTTMISTTSVSLNAAIIFIGGKDDREALVYAGRVARHPGVKLTVIRFLLEVNGDSVSSKISRGKINTAEHEEEMKLDDECFAQFYDRHVAGGRVAYMEKYLVNSGQTFSTLRSLEGQYSLFIVGRAGRVNSVLTVGMNDLEECPELGPIGDILAASEFSTTASVLIIQQHSPKGELDGLHDEFSVM